MEGELKQYADEVIYDNLGGVFGVKKGEGPKVKVAGHMDELGFMVTHITKNGMIRFQPIGGWWNQVLLALRVQIMTDNGPVISVIGSIPPHNLTEEQRKKPMEIKNMLIDIGADDEANVAEIGIRPGQPLAPICPSTHMANADRLFAQ